MKITIGRRIVVGLAAAGLLAAYPTWANNLSLTNMVLKPLDDTRARVQFDISWANSWRHTNINHDAAWVFFKVKSEGRSDWEHVTLETNGYSTGTGTPIEIVLPDDQVGCFIRRAGEGSGTLSVTNVKLAWNYASNSLVKTDRVRLQAFAVEMVYVAEGSFFVGNDTTNIEASFTEGNYGGNTNAPIPFQITNESAITLGTNAGNLWAMGGVGVAGLVPNAFPKGYAAFYCMKYEVTQGQYRDFLNTLNRVHQCAHTATQLANYFALSAQSDIKQRNGIRCPSSVPLPPGQVIFGCDGNTNTIMNETNDAMDRACNYLSWDKGCAFADWAGLRPMTELEFEKACRGPLAVVSDEYAWGNTIMERQTGQVGTDGSGRETATPTTANYHYSVLYGFDPFKGPVRVGIYATTNSARQIAGASYWGIMNLSGNVTEPVVCLTNAPGQAFTGLHGDGRLNVLTGKADVSQWPESAGASFRGGSYDSTFESARIACRQQQAAYGLSPTTAYGFRCVRTAQSEVGP